MSAQEAAAVNLPPSSSNVAAAAPAHVEDFVSELKKATEANFHKLVGGAVEEVKKQLKDKASAGFDRHEVTLASDRLTKAVAPHFLHLPGLTVSCKGRSLTIEW